MAFHSTSVSEGRRSGSARRLRGALSVVLATGACLALSAGGARADVPVGQRLSPGAKTYSPDGHYVLIMQDDGNLVEYAWPRPLWASNTNRPGTDLEMQGDGNLVLYGPGHVAVWASNTDGHPGAYLQVQNDGNLVVRTPSGTPVWASGSVDSRLDAGQRLNPGWQIQTPDRALRLVMQTDGNLVAYRGATPVWASGTKISGSEVEMQGDGNLVIYSPGHLARWASGTLHANTALVAQNDGNFVLYAPGNHAVWSTKTNVGTSPAPAPHPASLSSCPQMQVGSLGPCVALLQTALNAAHTGPPLAVDGMYGQQTRRAVVDYQSSRGLQVDGVAGPQTLTALASGAPPAGQAPSHRYPASFDPARAAAWAEANVLTPSNDPYMQDDPCTQFVSRALYAAGLPYTDTWYPDNDPIATYIFGAHLKPEAAWYAVDNLRTYLLANNWVTQRLWYPSTGPQAVSLGDLVYYQWHGTTGHDTHLAMVTKISGGHVYVSDQGGKTIRNQDRLWNMDHNQRDLTKDFSSMKVYILHWQ